MRFIARVFARDLVEISRSRGPLILIFVVPVVLMLLIGNLKVRDPIVRVAIVADADSADDLRRTLDARLTSALQEISSVEIVRWKTESISLRERAVREKVDLVAVLEGTDWHFYSPLTNNYRLQFAQAVAQDMALSMQRYAQLDKQLKSLRQLTEELRSRKVAPAAPTAVASAAAASAATSQANPGASIAVLRMNGEAIRMVDELAQEAKEGVALPTPVLRAWLLNQLTLYFPPASQKDHSLVPGFVALIAVFLPFLLASSAFVREREAGTLEMLIIAARRNWARIAAGKLLMPVFVAMVATLLLLVAARTAFGFGIKPGFLLAFGVLLVAAVVSALMGLSISTLIQSSQDAYTTSASYLVACILITGLIYPVEQAAHGVLFVSYLFPLTLSGPPVENWMLKGSDAVVEPWRWAGLFLQLAAALALCALAVQRLRKRI